MKAEFIIVVYSNAHYMDESEAYSLTGFASYTEALVKSKEIVERSLEELYKPENSASEWLSAYKMFGDDPVIAPTPASEPPFSAWEYASTYVANRANRE
ncbi:MAG: hypothetical protein JNJ57_00910 [Saprospiraceae bacterium]|nr:hypothetical protein [Saprospiraceae bacterium]